MLTFAVGLVWIGTGKSGASQLEYWGAAAAVTVFGAWSRPRSPRESRWSNGAITYVSRNGRVRASRSWGTARGPSPSCLTSPRSSQGQAPAPKTLITQIAGVEWNRHVAMPA